MATRSKRHHSAAAIKRWRRYSAEARRQARIMLKIADACDNYAAMLAENKSKRKRKRSAYRRRTQQ